MSFLIPILLYLQVLVTGTKPRLYEFDDILNQCQTQSKTALHVKTNVIQSFFDGNAINQKRNQ